MEKSSFVYVTYINTTPEKLWSALTDVEFIKQYWFGIRCESNWTMGSSWKMLLPDGRIADTGAILEIDPPQRMVIRWQNEWKSELKAEGPSRCTIALEPLGRAVKLTIIHEIDRPESELIKAMSVAWPLCISNLKSLLETGEVVITSHPGH